MLTSRIPPPDADNAALLRRESPPDRLAAVARVSGARLRSNENLVNSKKNRETEKKESEK